MISRLEILKGQECPPELEENLSNLLIALNKFRTIYGIPMITTSGYRDPNHNADIGGAPHSAHCLCLAADFSDPDPHPLRWFCLKNQNILVQCGLFMEAPTSDEDSHVHLTIRSPQSGNIVFQA